jgi:signal transduction histidine kinase/AmiR/NasT family two-component response regulator
MVDLLESFVADIGYALFEFDTKGEYRVRGRIPDWFRTMVPLPEQPESIDLPSIFPQLEAFQPEVLTFWSSSPHRRLNLGIWEFSSCPTEPTLKIGAFATKLQGRNLFGLQCLNGSLWEVLEHMRIGRQRELEHSLELSNRDARELELAHEKSVAEHLSGVKSMFVAKMSHELRTPLTAICSALTLASKTELNDVQRTLLSDAMESAKMITRLATDLIDLTKVESDQFELTKEQFDLSKLVHDAGDRHRPAAAYKRIVLHVRVADAVPRLVLSDPMRLQQIMDNLVGNAIKFTEQGFVEVGVSVADPRKPSRVRFSVRDTGIGIPRDKVDSIFDTFVRVDSDNARKLGGTGLGLSVVKRLVELMGGKIQVRTELGLGSEFWFEVEFTTVTNAANSPVNGTSASQNGTTKANRECQLSGNRIRVLIADDHPVNLRLVRHILTNSGCVVTDVEDGLQALQELTENKYDVAVLDWKMPGLVGTDVVRRFRASEKSKGLRLPIIALTAFVTEHDRNKCIQAGFDVCLGKPFELDQLVDMVHRLGAKRRSLLPKARKTKS